MQGTTGHSPIDQNLCWVWILSHATFWEARKSCQNFKLHCCTGLCLDFLSFLWFILPVYLWFILPVFLPLQMQLIGIVISSTVNPTDQVHFVWCTRDLFRQYMTMDTVRQSMTYVQLCIKMRTSGYVLKTSFHHLIPRTSIKMFACEFFVLNKDNHLRTTPSFLWPQFLLSFQLATSLQAGKWLCPFCRAVESHCQYGYSKE